MRSNISSTKILRHSGIILRNFTCAALVAFVTSFVPTVATAGSAIEVEAPQSRSLDSAKQFIMELAQQSMIVLNAPDRTLDQRKVAFRKLWGEGVAFETISRFVLGRHWRSATPEQRERYQALFTDSVMRTSETVLSSFTNEQLVVTDARLTGKKDMMVSTRLVRSEGPSVPVDWRVRIIEGRYQIIDVTIEGVSMILTKRSEYSAVVKSKGLEGLLTALQSNT